jgi:Tfp pilus assembly protein PilN
MRPVNLIPAEERRERTTMQGAPAYVVIGALVAVLAGVTLLVVTNNQISERKAEVAHLQQQNAAAEARAARLTAYSKFGEVRDQRVAAVTSLADSRFDWERVMRELALILPKGDVWLTSLTGTASPEVTLEGGGSVTLRSAIPGPALELVGCATGQSAVAGFVSSLKEIDGVTRVGVQSSELLETEGGGGATTDSAGSGGSSECKAPAAKFEIVVAFDAAPVPATAASEEAAAAAEAAPAPEGSSTTPTTSTTPSGG